MHVKPRFALSAVLAALTLLATWGSWPASAQPRRMIIATAGTAGALYPMGVALAETINAHSQEVKASAEASAGSLQNLHNLSLGEVEWGISQNEMAYFAHAGQGPYQGRALTQLRSLFGTLISWVQVVTPAAGPIRTLADLRGKKVGVGAPGSGGEQTARLVLAANGLDYTSVRTQYMSNLDMASALKDGSLDAFIVTHPLGSALLQDLAHGLAIRFLPIADPVFYAKHPYYSPREIPAGTYPGQDQPVTTATSRVVMLTTSDQDSDQIQRLLAVIWDHADQWTGVHPSVSASTSLAHALEGVSVPLHPGAAAFYAERGLTIPAGLNP